MCAQGLLGSKVTQVMLGGGVGGGGGGGGGSPHLGKRFYLF